MASVELLSELFDDFGFDLKTDIVAKCLEFSITYDIEPRELVEIFIAYCANHINNGEPTLSTLDDFERKELQKRTNSSKSTAFQPQRNPIDIDEYGGDSDGEDDNDVMSAYIDTTPKAEKIRRSHHLSTPDAKLNTPSLLNNTTISSPYSGLNESSNITSGKAVYTFGQAAIIQSISWLKDTPNQSISIERYTPPNANTNNNNNNDFTNEQDYMFDTMEQKSNIAGDRIFDTGQQICSKLIEDPSNNFTAELYNQISHPDIREAMPINTIGRIYSENDDKLQLHSTVLIGADEHRLRSVRLNFSRMKRSYAQEFSLFPGQTVMLQGLNPRGELLYVDEIYTERSLTYAETPALNEDLYIVTAAGPFTSNTDLTYEPLNDLIAYCKIHKPDILILLGPFVDADHPLVEDVSMKLTFEAQFESILSRIVEDIGSTTEVLLVSSSRDAHSSTVYPTNPYTSKMPYKNVRFLPDPSLVKINGLTIALTTTDIYSHILDVELSDEFSGNSVKRIVNHLFHQSSFYPLNPPSPKVSYDAGLADRFATLSVVPNIFIMSSSAKYFARDVNNCLVINSGPLVNNGSRGAFGRLFVKHGENTKTIRNCMACQIVRV